VEDKAGEEENKVNKEKVGVKEEVKEE